MHAVGSQAPATILVLVVVRPGDEAFRVVATFVNTLRRVDAVGVAGCGVAQVRVLERGPRMPMFAQLRPNPVMALISYIWGWSYRFA